MKKIVFICVFLTSMLFAVARPPRLVDHANLLTADQQVELENTLNEISERQQCDVAIITVNSTNGKDIVAMADDIYDYDGYGMGSGDDGILFLIDMENREWAISTYGFAIDAFTDVGQERLMDKVIPYLSSGDYNKAFTKFAVVCDEYITKAKDGNPVGAYTPPSSNNNNDYYYEEERMSPISLALVCVGISVAFALVVMLIQVNQLKSVKTHSNASNYIRDPLYLTQSRDMYLYRNVTRRARPKETNHSSSSRTSHHSSSTHRSSSGRSHGGSRGRF